MPQSVSGSSFFGRLSSARSSLAGKEHKATVQLLDDSETIQCEFKKSDTGQALLDYVCDYLNVIEKDYFGLRYQDTNKHRYWLDTTKQITKQVRALELHRKSTSNLAFRLRIRYYPADPSVLKEEITRYQLFLQLRRDLLHGRLYCPQNEAATLGAYIIQSELGDYDPIEHKEGYVSEYKLFLKQTSKLEEKIAHVHQGLSGLSPANAELEFLKRAAQLDTYGFDPHTVKDAKQGSIYVGVTHQGILVYQANRKVHHIKWNDLDKVDYLGKEFRVYPKSSYFSDDITPPVDAEKTLNGGPHTDIDGGVTNGNGANGHSDTHFTIVEHHNSTSANSNESPKGKRGAQHILKYQCPSATFAKHLWRHTLSQQAFFTSARATDVKPKFSKPRIPLLSRGSTFRYTGRVLHEIEEAEAPARENPTGFVRYHLEKQPGRDERQYPWLKYNTLPRSYGSKNKNAENGLNTSLDSDPSAMTREAPVVMTSSLSDERVSSPMRPVTVTTDDGKGSPTFDLSPVTANGRPSSAFEREKVTTFTIHLSRTDPSPQPSPPVSPLTPEEDSSLVANSSAYRSEIHNFSTEPTPLAISTPKRDIATIRNGTVRTAEKTQQPAQAGTCRNVLRSLLTFLLIAFILVTIIVAIFEVKDGHFQKYVHAVPGAEQLRHQIYEPSRGFILEHYNRVTNKSRY